MSVPRLVAAVLAPQDGQLVRLGAEQAQHLRALRLRPGEALELLLEDGPWRADLALLERDWAEVRLVGPVREQREPPFPIEVYLPITVQLGLVDDLLPPLVELGATRLRPIAWARSGYDARRTLARLERWRRIVAGAAEQSHRDRIPILDDPAPFTALLACAVGQRWLASELPSGEANPPLQAAAIALASGPEGGISDAELADLRTAGWRPVSLGRSILRAVTAPVALLGAVRYAAPD